jgi:tetratricopeptide (TPR) repeat protein
MRCAPLWFAVIAACLPPATPGQAGEKSWVGKTILTKKSGLRLRDTAKSGKEADVATLTFGDYRVLAEKGGRIKVRHDGAEGWFDKQDAVPLGQAVDYFTDRVRANPKDALAFVGRGIAYDLADKQDDAIPDFDEAIRLNPKGLFGFNNRGIAWAKKGDLDKAIRDFDAVVRLDPKYAGGFNNRGLCWKDKKEFAKAIRDYEEATRLNPKDPRPIENRAWVLATCPDPKYRDGKKAVELARQAGELEGWKNRVQLEILAAAYAEAGQFDEAVRWQQKALDDPDYARAQGEPARLRLELYQNKKPFREE